MSTREPQKLQRQTQLLRLKQGVYRTIWGTHEVRVIVLSQVPQAPKNAIWQMFSSIPESVQSGAAQYHWHRPQYSTIMHQLYHAYAMEGITMPYTWDEYFRDITKEHLTELSPEEILTIYPPEELLKRIPPEERLKDLSPEEVLSMLRSETLLEKLQAADLDELLKKLRQTQHPQHRN